MDTCSISCSINNSLHDYLVERNNVYYCISDTGTFNSDIITKLYIQKYQSNN